MFEEDAFIHSKYMTYAPAELYYSKITGLSAATLL